MLAAIIVGLLTFAGLVVAIVLLFRSRNAGSADKVSTSHGVSTIGSVGVPRGEERPRRGHGQSEVRVQRSQSASGGTPGDTLKTRFVAMGVLTTAIFGSLGAKLWSMQIMQHDQYAQRAQQNLYTTIYTPAPRGVIFDAGGNPLVRNRSSFTVLADAEVVNDHNVLLRLSGLLGIPFEIVRKRASDTAAGAQNRRVIATDVDLASLAYISEHADAFGGVTTENRTTREYPYGALAAHVLGYSSTVTDEELSSIGEGRDLQSGDTTGKSGVEAHYDDVLSGEHGKRVLLTDADGQIVQVVSEIEATKGNDIQLTIRAQVQQVADKALASLIAPEGNLGAGTGTAGALVCLDCTNGEVVAMSNYPTYSPGSFIGGIASDVWENFNSDESYYPLMNRCISGTYPAASTFKAFTAMAALQDGLITKDTTFDCAGTWIGFGEEYPQKCWNTLGHGPLDLVGGISNSCDVVFYEIAKAFYNARDTLGIDAMQNYVMQFGFGRETGIDLGGEAQGRIPTPEWKAEYFKDVPAEASWQPGDLSNMVIGQGYVLVTPLQLAAGYCGIATGKIMKPHVLREVRNSFDNAVVKGEGTVEYEPQMSPENLAVVHEGLGQVASVFNVVANSFAGYGYTYACKTGTAEVQGKGDYGWFAVYSPAENPKYVCACIIEEGSAGSASASPCADVLAACMAYDEGTIDMKLETLSATYRTVERTAMTGAGRSD